MGIKAFTDTINETVALQRAGFTDSFQSADATVNAFCENKGLLKKTVKLTGALLGTTALVAGMLYMPWQMLGFASAAIMLNGLGFSDNKHVRGTRIFTGALFALQYAMTGNPGGFIQTAMISARNIGQSFLTDDNQKGRNAIAYAGMACMAGFYAVKQPALVQYLPAVGAVLGMIAEKTPSHKSHVARAWLIASAVPSILYAPLSHGSIGHFIHSSLGMMRVIDFADKNDVPRQTTEKKDIASKQAYRLYWQSLLKGEKAQGVSLNELKSNQEDIAHYPRWYHLGFKKEPKETASL